MKSKNLYLKVIKLCIIIFLIIVIGFILKNNFYNIYEGAETLEDKQQKLQEIVNSFTTDIRSKLNNIINKKTLESEEFTRNLIAEYRMVEDSIEEDDVDGRNDLLNELKNRINNSVNEFELNEPTFVTRGTFIDIENINENKIKGLINSYL